MQRFIGATVPAPTRNMVCQSHFDPPRMNCTAVNMKKTHTPPDMVHPAARVPHVYDVCHQDQCCQHQPCYDKQFNTIMGQTGASATIKSYFGGDSRTT